MNLKMLTQFVPAVKNYPREGVIFRDISPLLNDNDAREFAFQQMADNFLDTNIDIVVGLDARGFIFGQALSSRLGCRFVMFRKPSKLPGDVETVHYNYEYSTGTIECQKGLIRQSDKVLIVDDILATGGSANAAVELVSKFKGKVIGISVLVEIVNLKGREALSVPVESLLKFDGIRNVTSVIDIEPRNFFLTAPSKAKDRFVILCHPSMQCITNDIIQRFPDMFSQGKISWKRFPDTYPNITFDYTILNGAEVIFIGSLYDQEKFIEQVSMITILPRQFIKSLDIIFPYFAPGTMERVEEEGVLATAEPVAKLLSSQIPFTKNGPAIIHFLDIHAPIIRFYFTDNVFPQLHTHIPKVLEEMRLMTSDFCIAFPDEGAYKRFKSITGNIPTVVCSKVREADKRIVKITDFFNWNEQSNDKLPKHVLIIDDLVQTGGTLDECRKALISYGFFYVSAYVTHAVFPNRCYKRFLKDGDRFGFFTFFITDSIPEVANKLKDKKPFRVLSIANNLGQSLLKLYKKTSTNSVSIILASTSKSKTDAVKFAANNYFPQSEIRFIDVEWNVRGQLFGLEEISSSAANRLAKLELFVGKGMVITEPVIFVSIENGIVDEYLYISCIKVKVLKGISQEYSEFTEPVSVPFEALSSSFNTVSVEEMIDTGKVLYALKGYNSENWNHDVHGINISYFIYKTLDNIFSKFKYI